MDKILSCPALPSLPTVALKVLELTSDENVKLDEIANVVQNDMALASKILKTINSSFYGLSKPCPTISRAVALLGMSTVKSLVLGFSLVDMTRRNKVGLDLDVFWCRNVYGATAARKVALHSGICDPEESFLAGIMLDVAMLAMDVVIGEPYRELISSVGDDHNKFPAAERELLGFDHAFVGSKLAAKWRLAKDQAEAIANHHKPERAAESTNPLVKTTTVASAIARVLLVDDDTAARNEAEQLASDVLGFDAQIVAEIIDATREDSRALSRQLLSGANVTPARDEILSLAEEARLEHQYNMQREAEELRKTAHDMAEKAVTDALTKVGNRALLDQELAENHALVKSTSGSFAFILMDADRFKKLNDTYGHQVGDEVLIELARRFREAVGEDGLVCRYGGEEFAVLLPGHDEQMAAEMAERLRLAVANESVSLDGATHGVSSVDVTVSAGVSVMSQASSIVFTRPELITQAADKALYAAKHAGRNCVRVFRPRKAANNAA